MFGAVKKLARGILRRSGNDLTWCTPDEIEQLNAEPGLLLRDVLLRDTLSMRRHQLNLMEARFLGELVREIEVPGPIIEIGTLFGWSARIIALNKEQEREFITVDLYQGNPFWLSNDLHYEINRIGLRSAIEKLNVKLVKANKDDFCAEYDGPVPALVFIDADHSYEATKKDIDWARSLGVTTICGHDYRVETCPGVVKAVDEHGGPARIVDALWVL